MRKVMLIVVMAVAGMGLPGAFGVEGVDVAAATAPSKPVLSAG